MRQFFISTFLLLAAWLPVAVGQTDGWTSSCPPTYPAVSEVMIDACGDEFQSEYVVLRTKTAPFDIRNFSFQVTNPYNSSFVGSVAIANNSINADAMQALRDASGAACGYGTVFRDAFSAPYNGIITPNSTVLVFNNKDSTDVAYLSANALSRLCGSKVFVVFGTLTAQSRGVSIFRNYPQNGSCGVTFCLRKIEFKFNGQACSEFTYDMKKLPHVGGSNPPVGFNEGSYISPNADGTLNYGGGNLTGAGVNCMPTSRLECVIPPMPSYGDGFWNVLAFDGQNTYNSTDFKGFYAANDHDPTTVPADTIDGSFTFNTALDGWKANSAPSEAIQIDGARATYDGCNVRSDSFSIQAKRQGFPCGFYKISWKNYDDNARIRLDADGDGTFEFDQNYAAPNCSAGCGGTVWQGDLGVKSRMEIFGSEYKGSFNLHLIFQKDTVGHPTVKINVLATTPVVCGGAATGTISTSITGGTVPYTTTWRGATPIPAGVLMPTGLTSGIFHLTAIDARGCADSAQILVPQTNNITVQAFGDATFCPNSTATLRGAVLGGNGALTVNWMNSTSEDVLSTSLNFSPKVPKSTTYILRATDATGCFKTDTVEIKTHYVRKVRVTFTPKDTICNDEVAVFTARGSNNYTWTSFPQIGSAALNPQNEKATLFALFLPAPNYYFYAAGVDANGCRDTGSARIWINPLPVVTISPVLDTLCDDAAPYKLIGTPVGGRFYSNTCGTCVENGFFYPTRAGVGSHEVQHNYTDVNGCDNTPSILIRVKSCRCPTSVTVPLTRAICSGDSLKIKNIFYKTAGVYRDTFQERGGCDSVIVLTLNIKKRDTTRQSVQLCAPATAGVDTIRLTNVSGCDSMVITTKTLKRSDSTRLNYPLCTGDSVRVNGNWIKAVGETRIRLNNSVGCDSTLIVNLTFSKRDTIFKSATTCNRLNVGTDTVKLRNQFGCDSLIITTRRLVLSDTIRLSATSCNPARVGLDTAKLRNILGCDSLIITTTRLALADTTNRFLTTCNPQDSGTRTVRLVSSLGCDSIVITKTQLKTPDTTRLLSTTCIAADSGTTTRRLLNRFGCDSVVILKTTLSRRDTTPLIRKICSGDSLRFNNQWLKTAGIFTQKLRNTEGCDSTLILTLSVQNRDTFRRNATSCDPLRTGVDTLKLQNRLGCDSLIITTTRFANADTTLVEKKTCSAVLIGSVTTRFVNRLGCDSVVITTTKLSTPDTSRLFSKTCIAADSGTTTRRLVNQLGCDSIVILKTTLSRRDSIRQTRQICSTDSVRLGNQWLKTAGVFTQNLRNTEGCDSVVILTLQILKSDTTIIPKTTCNSDLVGDKTETLRNGRGCDSVIITRTTYTPSTIRITLTTLKSISCYDGSDGSIKISSIQNATPQYQILWSNGGRGNQIDSLRAGLYTVIITDNAGCTVRESVQLTEPAATIVRATGIPPRCFSESQGAIRLDSIIGGTAPYALVFQNNRYPITTLPRRLDSIRLGYHSFQIVDGKGCITKSDVEIPQAADRSLALGSDRRITLGDSTVLTGFMNFTPKNLQWTWTPKDSSLRCSTCLPTTAKPTETTTYRLLVRDSAGCEINDQIIVYVDKPRNVFIPTTFSPNNDLVNDFFTIYGDASVKTVQTFRIFNRWGDPVFARTNFPLNVETEGWDGSMKGVALPPDVYVFVAVVEFIDGKVLVFKGNVTLVR
jgi:gliding motility-associated-like protein